MASSSGLPTDVLTRCIYERTAPPKQIFRELKLITEQGAALASARRRWGWLALLALVAGVLTTLGGLGGSGSSGSGTAPAIVIGLLMLGFALWAFIMYQGVKRKCFEARSQSFIGQTLRLLEADMAPDSPVNLKLDLRPPDHKDKLTDTGKVGDWTVSFYKSPWLSMGGKLLDGTHFYLEMTSLFQARRKTKTNPRGKKKVKAKSRENLRARLQLKVRPGRYPRIGELVLLAGELVKLPSYTAVRRFHAEGDRLTLEVSCGSWTGAETPAHAQQVNASHMVAMMFLSLYQLLNRARVTGNAQPEQGGR